MGTSQEGQPLSGAPYETFLNRSPEFRSHDDLPAAAQKTIDAFMIDVRWNFDKMQMIFKAITGSSSHAFWWERTVLHSMETVVGRWSGSL